MDKLRCYVPLGRKSLDEYHDGKPWGLHHVHQWPSSSPHSSRIGRAWCRGLPQTQGWSPWRCFPLASSRGSIWTWWWWGGFELPLLAMEGDRRGWGHWVMLWQGKGMMWHWDEVGDEELDGFVLRYYKWLDVRVMRSDRTMCARRYQGGSGL